MWVNVSKEVDANANKAIPSVIANFKQMVKNEALPLITQAVDKETLEKMGAKPAKMAEGAS